jgi:quercetin dioxygenase-like cupin family protein
MALPACLNRWDEIALEKITEMISRKIIPGDRVMLAHVYLKRGALVPMHRHESEQMTYVLQGALRARVGDNEFTVREGEVLHIPSGTPHQAEALDDTLELDVFCPGRQEWLGNEVGETGMAGR